ncbi:MAG TPA: hypothetical protein VNL15_00240 [Dehalococcoidia bacterium]|nr:hypothetical protein [Dehalococcoidia bacterium]
MATALAGTLVIDSLPEVFSADAENVWSLLRRGPKSASGVGANPNFPYLRDYIDMLLMMLAAAHFAIFARQWHKISMVLPTLWKDGVLNSRVISANDFEQLLAKYDNRYNSSLASLGCFLGASAGIGMALWAFSRWGMYSSLIPGGASNEWQRQAYEDWWGNLEHHRFVAIWNVLVYAFCLYHLLKTNWIGIISILMIREITSRFRNMPEAAINLIPDHPDGEGGSRIFREILVDVLLSVFITAICAILVLGYLPEQALTQPMFIGVIAVLFLILGPTYVVYPYWTIGSEMRKSKDMLIREALSNIRRLQSHQSLIDRMRNFLQGGPSISYWTWFHMRVLSLPDSPIPLLRLTFSLIFYLLSAIPVIELVLRAFPSG